MKHNHAVSHKELPFPRTYWVDLDDSWRAAILADLDPSEARRKLGGLVVSGVTKVISLMEANETGHGHASFREYCTELTEIAVVAGKKIECDRFEIRDVLIPSIARMEEILAAIDDELSRGGCVYVHCWGGRGRTGTVGGCWLIQNGRASAETVLDRLKTLTAHNQAAFTVVPETEEQRQFVRRWVRTN